MIKFNFLNDSNMYHWDYSFFDLPKIIMKL